MKDTSYDADRNPELVKVNGVVTFTPLLKQGDVVQWSGPNGPESLVFAPTQCRVSDGIIMHLWRARVEHTTHEGWVPSAATHAVWEALGQVG